MKLSSLKQEPEGFTDDFFRLTHDFTGITIRPERRSMLEGRLRKRLRHLNLDNFTDYLDYIKRQPEEREGFINAVTTNETYFYRTPRVWEYIEEKFLPCWYAANKGKTINVWSAASSTGEEAHTLGIFMQQFKDANSGFEYRVKGTDIDSSVVEKARAGIYNGRSVERFRVARPELFSQYLKGSDDDGYAIQPGIKSRLEFTLFNLFSVNASAQEFDLVLLRNVLIYFNREDQEKVMATVHKRLKPGGVVIIGESESLNNINTSFEYIAPTIYQPLASRAGSRLA